MMDRNEHMKRELECPVCLEEMEPPKQIWNCANGHAVCGDCREKGVVVCPTCKTERLDFRCIALEKMAMMIL